VSLLLTPAEAVLYRTGPNCITILLAARGGFDAGRALAGLHRMVEDAERFHRVIRRRVLPVFDLRVELDWPAHVAVLHEPSLADPPPLMDAMRRLALPPDRPLWRAVLVNPGGEGWCGLALHFDHAIADGTRISRHILTRARPAPEETRPTGDLPRLNLADLRAEADPRLGPAPSALVRLTFDGLRRAVPDATGHADALLRLAHRMLGTDPAFAGLPAARRDRAAVARIEALRAGDGTLGNRAVMTRVDLSAPGTAPPARALFDPRGTPWAERTRMALARVVPAALLRPIVQAEFSRPGVVLTVVPVARRLPPLFGLDLTAIHPAAPALGRPPLAVTAVRNGDGFDACVTAHGPDGAPVEGLSTRVAVAMARAAR
jgi:hypothetical protein